jgi:hypothetical protein
VSSPAEDAERILMGKCCGNCIHAGSLYLHVAIRARMVSCRKPDVSYCICKLLQGVNRAREPRWPACWKHEYPAPRVDPCMVRR